MFSQNCNLFEFQRSKKSLCSCTLNGFLFWLNDFYVFWYSPYYWNAELIKIRVFPPQNTPLRVRTKYPSRHFFSGTCLRLSIWGGNAKMGYYFPPISERDGGEIELFFPPISERRGGEITAISPPHGGEIEKILRNQPPRLSIFLKKIAFPCSKLSKFSPAAR